MQLATAVAPLLGQGVPPAAPALPVLPVHGGWVLHDLAARRHAGGTLCVGSFGQRIHRPPPGPTGWEPDRHATAGTAWLELDFVQASALGPRGEVWYQTVGNGSGLSLARGRAWKNWTYAQLGP